MIRVMFFTILFSCLPLVSLAEVAVIVHPSNGVALSQDDISGIFLAKVQSFPGGGGAVPIVQPNDTGPSIDFRAAVIKKTPQQLKAYWSQLVFTGQGTPPQEVTGDAEVIKLVASNPNIIGYISAGAVTGDVKVVATY